MTTSSNRPPIRTAELADPTMDRAEFLKSALDKAVAENAGLKQRIAALEAALVEAGDGAHHDDRIVAKRALRGMAEEMEADRG